MSSEADRLELDGYLTAVSAASGVGRELYLHSQERRTFRILFDATTRFFGTADPMSLPVGPAHRIRVVGRVDGDPLLPTLRAERVETVRIAAADDGT